MERGTFAATPRSAGISRPVPSAPSAALAVAALFLAGCPGATMKWAEEEAIATSGGTLTLALASGATALEAGLCTEVKATYRNTDGRAAKLTRKVSFYVWTDSGSQNGSPIEAFTDSSCTTRAMGEGGSLTSPPSTQLVIPAGSSSFTFYVRAQSGVDSVVVHAGTFGGSGDFTVNATTVTLSIVLPGAGSFASQSRLLAGTLSPADYVDAPTGSDARFSSPRGVASDGTYLYVVDAGNRAVRQVDPSTGATITLMGGPSWATGQSDSTGHYLFCDPRGAAVRSGYLYFVSGCYHNVVSVNLATGAASVYAGPDSAVPSPGYADGSGTSVRFNGPGDIVEDGLGNLYVADTGNHVIRVISAAGVVSTAAGLAGASGQVDDFGTDARFCSPSRLAPLAGTLIYVHDACGVVRTLDLGSGLVSTYQNGDTGGPWDSMAADSGYLYVARGPRVYRLAHAAPFVGTLPTPYAGNAPWAMNPSGAVDGPLGGGSNLGTRVPSMALHGTDIAFVDAEAQLLRKLDVTGAYLTTIAGGYGAYDTVDGTGPAARFAGATGGGMVRLAPGKYAVPAPVTANTGPQLRVFDRSTLDVRTYNAMGPMGRDITAITTDSGGTVWAAVEYEVRRLTKSGASYMFEGNLVQGGSGHVDGPLASARALYLEGIAVRGGEIYLSEPETATIRKIDLSAGTLSTPFGLAYSSGYVNGTGTAARFGRVSALALHPSGNPLVAWDGGNHALRKIDLVTGEVSTLAGAPYSGGQPQDGSGTAARIDSIRSMAWAPAGDWLYFIESWTGRVRRARLADGKVQTVAGFGAREGVDVPGPIADASFHQPRAIAFGPQGELLLATDFGIHALDSGPPPAPAAAELLVPEYAALWSCRKVRLNLVDAAGSPAAFASATALDLNTPVSGSWYADSGCSTSPSNGATLTIAAGASSVDLYIHGTAQAANVDFTAQPAGLSAVSGTTTFDNGPGISFAPSSSINFGPLLSGLTASATVTLSHAGGSSIPITSLTPREHEDPPFRYLGGAYPGTGGTCGDTLLPAQSCDVVVEFAPQSSSDPTFGTLQLDYENGMDSGTNVSINPNGSIIPRPGELDPGFNGSSGSFSNTYSDAWSPSFSPEDDLKGTVAIAGDDALSIVKARDQFGYARLHAATSSVSGYSMSAFTMYPPGVGTYYEYGGMAYSPSDSAVIMAGTADNLGPSDGEVIVRSINVSNPYALFGPWTYSYDVGVGDSEKVAAVVLGNLGSGTRAYVVGSHFDGVVNRAFVLEVNPSTGAFTNAAAIAIPDSTGTAVVRGAAIDLSTNGILIVGQGRSSTSTDEDVFVLRVDSALALDTSYGDPATPGARYFDLGGTDEDVAAGIAMQPGGLAVIAARKLMLNGASFVSLLRVDGTGALDAGFGSGGVLVTSIDSGIAGLAVPADTVDKIVLGLDRAGQSAFEAVRFLGDGSGLDTDFGVAGQGSVAVPSRGGHRTRAIAVQSDGRILVGGSVYYTSLTPYHFQFGLGRLGGGN